MIPGGLAAGPSALLVLALLSVRGLEAGQLAGEVIQLTGRHAGRSRACEELQRSRSCLGAVSGLWAVGGPTKACPVDLGGCFRLNGGRGRGPAAAA
jgi:hypothetical protein